MAIPRRHPQIIQELLEIWLGVLLGMVCSKGFVGKVLYIQQDRGDADAYEIPKIKWDVENWAHQIPYGQSSLALLGCPGNLVKG